MKNEKIKIKNQIVHEDVIVITIGTIRLPKKVMKVKPVLAKFPLKI